MGSVLSNLLTIFKRSPPMKVLMVGLDNAGKTTILYNFQEIGTKQDPQTTIPTVGFNVENIKIGNVTINVWDIGGQKKLRTLWPFYADGLAGLVYVIDIEDRDRWDIAVEELTKILEKDMSTSSKRYPVLILANKVDKIPDSKIAEVKSKLMGQINQDKLFLGRMWRMECCSAKSKDPSSIMDGFTWLADNLIEQPKA